MNIIVFDQSIVTDILIYWNPVENVAVTENISFFFPLWNINVNDSIVVSENIDIIRAKTRDISIFDVSVVTDYVGYYQDQSFITESVTFEVFDYETLFDTSSVTESIVISIIEGEFTADDTVVTDILTNIQVISTINVFELSTTIGILTQIEIFDFETLFDQSTVTESFVVFIPFLFVRVSEASKVIDIAIPEPFYSNNAPLYYGLDTGEINIMLGLNTMPTWGNNNRPAAPKNGTFGFNYDTSKLEIWNSGAWRTITLS